MIFDAIDKLSHEEWEWGALDCCQFVRRVMQELHGVDFAPDAPEYTTEKEAVAIVHESGGMERFASQYFGDPVPRNLLRRGDVCLADTPAGRAIGVCTGNSAAFASPSGITHIPMSLVIKGWRV